MLSENVNTFGLLCFRVKETSSADIIYNVDLDKKWKEEPISSCLNGLKKQKQKMFLDDLS